MKGGTIILDCKSGAGSFKAVSLPGMVGVLSGVAKGRFSITINSKEDRNHIVPNFGGWGATLLLRWIFESCSSYEEALRELKRAPAFVPFYATVVGPKRGQAAVVEVNKNGKNRVYKQPGFPVAVGNHYPGEICELEIDSQERQDLVEARAQVCKAKSLRGCFSVISEFPVMYAGTVQSMVLHPKSGTVLLQQT
jgi:acid ceramidase